MRERTRWLPALVRWPAEKLANAQLRRQGGIVHITLEVVGVEDDHLDVG